MRYFSAFLIIFAVCAACTDNAAAHPRGRSAPYVVTLEDESGRELRTFHHKHQTFVLGSFSERYNIRVENRTGRRIEAVVTVDGRDVINGHLGDFEEGRGYLVGPHDEVLIEGFRQNLSQVAAFRFSNPSDSYSARMGTPEHVGIIGVAIFPERVHRPIARPQPRLRRHHDAPRADLDRPSESAPAAASSPKAKKGRSRGRASSNATQDAVQEYEGRAERPAQNLGTEYGETRNSHVREVQFRRANGKRPAQLITLRYDDRDGLLARGIRLRPLHRITRREPDAFPHNRFAPPPRHRPNYRR